MGAVAVALLLNEIANTDFSLAQNDALLLVVALLALELMRRHRDLASGVLLGMVAVKPQLVFLAFIALLLQQRWRIAFACAITGATIIGISILMVGPSCSLQWLGSATQSGEFQIGIGAPSALARWTGDATLALAAFASLSIIAVLILWRIRSRVDTPVLVAVAISVAVVIGLHTLAYDVLFFVPLGLAVASAKPWLVVVTGWAFTVAQEIDSTYPGVGFVGSTPVRATQVIPLIAVILAIVFLSRSRAPIRTGGAGVERSVSAEPRLSLHRSR
jgi:hypothetical protein